MSQGSDVAAPAGAATPTTMVPATSAAAPHRTSNAFLACRSRDRTVIIGPAFLTRGLAHWHAGGSAGTATPSRDVSAHNSCGTGIGERLGSAVIVSANNLRVNGSVFLRIAR